MNRRNFLTGMAGILATGYAPLVGANLVRDGLIMRVRPIILPDSPFITIPCRNCLRYDCYGKCMYRAARPEYDWIRVTGIWNVGEGAGWYRADGTETTNYLESRNVANILEKQP